MYIECATQVWVYGDSFKSHLVAVVVPKQDAVMDWAKLKGKQGELGLMSFHSMP